VIGSNYSTAATVLVNIGGCLSIGMQNLSKIDQTEVKKEYLHFRSIDEGTKKTQAYHNSTVV
jgi:hypothetical protein